MRAHNALETSDRTKCGLYRNLPSGQPRYVMHAFRAPSSVDPRSHRCLSASYRSRRAGSPAELQASRGTATTSIFVQRSRDRRRRGWITPAGQELPQTPQDSEPTQQIVRQVRQGTYGISGLRHEDHHELTRSRHEQLVTEHAGQVAGRLTHPTLQAAEIIEPIDDTQ